MESNFCCSSVKKERFVFLNPIKNFFKQIFGYCPLHGWFLYPKRYRMNTAYVDDKNNYSIGCKFCQQESYEYYQELWNDYYGSRL